MARKNQAHELLQGQLLEAEEALLALNQDHEAAVAAYEERKGELERSARDLRGALKKLGAEERAA